jgi:hypothetical protein
LVRVTREELGANVRLSDPTLYRNVTLPLVKATLTWLKEPKLANALEKRVRPLSYRFSSIRC